MKKKTAKKHYGYCVHIDRCCDSYSSSDEQFGEWSSSYTNSFISISSGSSYPDVTSVERLDAGGRVFVVWVEWSSGDSFGNSTRGSVEPVGVFSKAEDAEGLRKAILNGIDGKYKYTATTKQEFSSEYAPWSGYFESLDEVHIESATML